MGKSALSCSILLAAASNCGRGVDDDCLKCSQGTYQQQQAVLKRKRLSAEAEAKIANELEQIRRDTWIVFMLVELLGSYLITPPWTAKVKLTDTNNSAAACANTDDECSGNSSACCSWNHGYVYGAEDASSSNGSQEGNGWQAREGSSSTGGGLSRKLGRASVDIMHHCISYPQFVEVLLCLLGARATVLLEPEVKQLRNIAADGEMQVAASTSLQARLCHCSCHLVGYLSLMR